MLHAVLMGAVQSRDVKAPVTRYNRPRTDVHRACVCCTFWKLNFTAGICLPASRTSNPEHLLVNKTHRRSLVAWLYMGALNQDISRWAFGANGDVFDICVCVVQHVNGVTACPQGYWLRWDAATYYGCYHERFKHMEDNQSSKPKIRIASDVSGALENVFAFRVSHHPRLFCTCGYMYRLRNRHVLANTIRMVMHTSMARLKWNPDK